MRWKNFIIACARSTTLILDWICVLIGAVLVVGALSEKGIDTLRRAGMHGIGVSLMDAENGRKERW